MNDDKRRRAILAGALLGDALGGLVRGLSLKEIQQVYGPAGFTQLPGDAGLGPFSAGLLRSYATKSEGYVELLPDANPAAQIMGLSPHIAHSDDDQLFKTVQRVLPDAENQPDALAATLGAAYLVALTVQGVHVNQYIGKVMTFCDGLSDAFDLKMLRIGHVLGWVDEDAALNHIGKGISPVDTVAMALYCVLRYDDDFIRCVGRAVNINGDSAAMGVIAGAVMGARLGDVALMPQAWRAQLGLDDLL